MFHAIVNPPLSGNKDIQMEALDLTNPLIRDRLRKVVEFDESKNTIEEAMAWMRDLYHEYIRIQPPAIRSVIDSWPSLNKMRYIGHVAVYAIEDLTGVIVSSEDGTAIRDIGPRDIIYHLLSYPMKRKLDGARCIASSRVWR